MGLINVDSIINDSSFLSQSKKFISSLDSASGSSDLKPKYIYPNDIDRQNAANYMVVYIYDNKKNSVTFQPISSQVAKSKIQKDLAKELTDCISINIGDKAKDKLKSYKKSVQDYLKNSLKDIFSSDNLKSIASKWGIDIDTPDWIKQTGEFLQDNMLTRGIKNIVDYIDLPQIPGLDISDLGDFKLEDYIDIDFNKDKFNNIVKELKMSQQNNTTQNIEDEGEAGAGFELKTSIVLPLPMQGITYESKIGIDNSSTKTAQAIKSVVDAAIQGKGVIGTVKNALEAGKDVIMAQDKELLYSMLGSGGSAIYQNNFGKIRDPLVAFTYSIPDPRTFQYDFIMAPRDKNELYDIWNIIKTLKFYSHMTIQEGAQSVKYYNMPGRFKIKYYTEGNENIWLGKTKILGLTSIQSSIDTSNIGFILNDFDKVSGNPPKVIALSMTFTELGILNREDINEGY